MAGLIADPLKAARVILSLRRQGIRDDGVLSALETVDRAAFVPPGLAEVANEDVSLPIEGGQVIPRPSVTAKLLQTLDIPPGNAQRVLLVGGGSGYTAALLSQLCRHVYAMERLRTLAEATADRLATLGVDNVSVRHGDGLLGLPEHGPFDRILLAGGLKTVPAVLIDQLSKSGRLVGLVSGSGGKMMLRAYVGRQIVFEEICHEAVTSLVPGVSQAL